MIDAYPNYKKIAHYFQALLNCQKNKNSEWCDKHGDAIEAIMNDAPSGSGIDTGTSFNYEESKPNRLVFNASFHHMNDGGFYDGWTEHKIIVTPSLQFDIDVRITGRDRNMIKDYLHDVYHSWLTE